MKATITYLPNGTKTAFEAPDPPLQAGEVLEFVEVSGTLAGHSFQPGDTLTLVRRTNEAPFGHLCSLGNWVVETKYHVSGNETIWSNIELALVEGRFRRQPRTKTRYEHILEEND